MSNRNPNSFLYKIIEDIQQDNSSLYQYIFVFPNKRPVVFFKRILSEKNYTGILPRFLTIDELLAEISELQSISGISLWLLAYKIYLKIDPREDLQSFLKWFPTAIKDWDDMLKFSESDREVLDFMLSDERLKNWGEMLGEEKAHYKNLTFWKKMNRFFPELKKELLQQNMATSGMIYEKAKNTIESFSQETNLNFVFCGFNAFTPVEEKLVKNLLQWDKAKCYFEADSYYLNDKKQEAGRFLRKYKDWKEFNRSRPFKWITDHFSEKKNIKVFEVSGNIAQTKLLPSLLKELRENNGDFSNTAVVLMDENLLPPTLESLQHVVESLNITMGFPLKNLSFSVAMKKLFYLQKQLTKNSSSYYYADLVPVLEELISDKDDVAEIKSFLSLVEERNLVYLSKETLAKNLGKLSYFSLLLKPDNAVDYLDLLIEFCKESKSRKIDDIDYETISIFEKAFISLRNQVGQYDFLVDISTLEVLINQLVSGETIDFQGEPLSGLQVMGLLETRLLNFENVIMLSTNEGKLPLGRSQNTYLPFDVRRNFGLNTFLENDSIYAYHFYRLIQDAQNVYLLFNGLTSGVNTGEKSRFVTQIEMESHHDIENFVVDTASDPIAKKPISIQKTPAVLLKLKDWKSKVSPSHLNAYLYNPLDFYLNQVLHTRLPDELEEEVSVRSFGNLVHFTLDYLYKNILQKKLTVDILKNLKDNIETAVNHIITDKLKYSLDYYSKGMNYIHKSIAIRIIKSIIQKDIDDVKEGNSLEILALEENLFADFYLDEEHLEKIHFNGFADRIDKFNDQLRIIDYKSSKTSALNVKTSSRKDDNFLLFSKNYKHELQLSIYAYCALNMGKFNTNEVLCGIWSFVAAKEGVKNLQIEDNPKINNENIELPLLSVKSIINEILNPDINFVETEDKNWN